MGRFQQKNILFHGVVERSKKNIFEKFQNNSTLDMGGDSQTILFASQLLVRLDPCNESQRIYMQYDVHSTQT